MTTSFRDRFVGIIPPVVTPLDDAGRFDEASAERLYNYHLDAGVHGLFLFGSSGEGALLTQGMRNTALQLAVKTTAGKVPVLVGIPAAGTWEAIEQSRIAKELGADAIVVTPPFYFPATQSEIASHFRAIHAAVDLPIVAYDIPVFVKTKMSLETTLQLAEDGVIVGLKDSSGDVAAFRRLILKRPAGFRMHTGSELLVDNVLFQGADGSVPGLANVEPRMFVELYDHWQAGRHDEARAIQEKLLRLFDVFTDFDGQVKMHIAVGAMKTAMMLRGVIATNRMCPPFTAVEPRYVDRMRLILSELKLL